MATFDPLLAAILPAMPAAAATQGQQGAAAPPQDLLGLANSVFGSAPATGSGGNPLMEAIQQALSMVSNAPGAAQEPVPGVTSPFGRMASTFAATLANQLGAPGAAAANESRIAAGDQAAAAAEQRNRLTGVDKQRERLTLMLKLGEAKAADLQNQADVEATRKQLIWNAATAERLKKLDLTASQEKDRQRLSNELKKIEARGAEQRRTSAYRQTITTHYSLNTPAVKVALARADRLARQASRRVQDMQTANRAATMAYTDQPYTQDQIDEAQQNLQDQIDGIYESALKEIQGQAAPSTPTSQTTTTSGRKPLSSFDK